jgi:ribosome-associated protein
MTTTLTHPKTRIQVQTAAAVCEEKKGEDTRILELDPIDSGLSDFFLITSGTNNRQTVAIADEIEMRLKRDFGIYPDSVEGRRKGEWVLLDYGDFVVHVFLTERRAFYDIERLRKSARPLTPTEFDAELKADLATKTLAARKKTTVKTKAAKAKPSAAKAKPAAKPKKTAKKSATVAAKPAKKTPAKKAVAATAAKKVTNKIASAKAVVTKTPAKKVAVKKPAAKEASAKKRTSPKA